MGSADFITRSDHPTVIEAFNAAVDHAKHQYGHRGYTGTIAEKNEFIVLSRTPAPEADARATAQELMDGDDYQGDPRIADKYGPAGALPIGDGDTPEAWLFFGFAST